MHRRHLLTLGAAALAGCTRRTVTPPALVKPTIAPLRAQADRIFRITVCLRPFRAAGPRLEVEKVGEKIVVHNYGHGGSGWSLSWGSSRIAADHALATNEKQIAVIGCGALGLTSALLLQQSGAQVTIYAKERPHETRSARATGSWTPDSRIAHTNAAPAGFGDVWERMARYSFARYQTYLGAAGTPVEWTDRYQLSDQPPTPRRESEFARYAERIADLTPRPETLAPGANPFRTAYASRQSNVTFHVAALSRQLLADFLMEGGRMVPAEFHTPADLARLPEKTIINATGYGARALWKDESIVPVRGQIAWLIPQPELTYGVMYKGVLMLARRDGIVIQGGLGADESDGFNNASEQPDRAQAERWVAAIGELYQLPKAAV